MAGDIKSAFEGLKNAFKDLTTLEVVTLTGELNVDLSKANAPGSIIDWKELNVAEHKLQVVAATMISADLDTVNYRALDATILTDDLVQLHRASAEAAINGRNNMIKTFFGLVTSKVAGAGSVT